MDARSPRPEPHGHLSDLPAALRRAVERVRAESPPPDAVARAVLRARTARAPARPWLARRAPWIILGAAAAAVLLLLGLRFPTTTDRLIEPGPSLSLDFVENASDDAHLYGRPRVFVSGGPISTQDQHPISLEYIGSHWNAWHRSRSILTLTKGGTRIETPAAISAYLKHVVWNEKGKCLRQARVLSGEESFRLLGLRVQVVIEGHRARTILDHIFSNPLHENANCLFEASLPHGASPSYFAVFAGDRLPDAIHFPNTSQTAPRLQPLPTPEQFVAKIDPACWGKPRHTIVAPTPRPGEPNPDEGTALAMGAEEPLANCFRAPIKPISPGSPFRVVLAYDQPLPLVDGKLVYQLPLPCDKIPNLSLAVQVEKALSRDPYIAPPDAKKAEVEGKVIFTRSWVGYDEAGELRFEANIDPDIQSTCGRDPATGAHYLAARCRPEIIESEKDPPFAKHAVFVLDTSAAEDSRRFDQCVKLMRAVLEKDADLTHFNVLTFATGAAWLSPQGWLPNTKESRDRILKRLDGIALEGAADVSAALAAVAKPSWSVEATTPVSCFLLADGHASWGETEVAVLASRFESHCRFPTRWYCYQTNLGEENIDLFDALTRTGGRVQRLAGPDDITKAALAHRVACFVIDRVRFTGEPNARDILIAGRRAAVHPGGEIQVAARFDRPGPVKLILEGTLNGQKVSFEHAVKIHAEGQLAPRVWGEMAVASLLAIGDPALEPLAIAYARHFRVASRLTSFAFGETRSSDTYLVYDLGTRLERAWTQRGHPGSPRAKVGELLADAVPLEARRDLVALFRHVRDSDLELPTVVVAGEPMTKVDLPPAYLTGRHGEQLSMRVYLDEAVRREQKKDTAGAIRVLSELVKRTELDRAAPNRALGTQVVAFHLLEMGQAVLASRLLLDQLKRDPLDPAINRAMGVALARAGKPAWAALHYEAALAQQGTSGGWFRAIRAEYADLLAAACQGQQLGGQLLEQCRIRSRELNGTLNPGDLRVSLTWNTVASDVQLIILDPNGKPIEVKNVRFQGDKQGPRVCEVAQAVKGTYVVEVRLLRASEETMPETAVLVGVIEKPGSPQEQRHNHLAIVRQPGQTVRVVGVKMNPTPRESRLWTPEDRAATLKPARRPLQWEGSSHPLARLP